MESYRFEFKDNIYELKEDNLDYFLNDEEKPVNGIEVSHILKLLNQAEEVNFSLEYYDEPCSNCLAGKREKEKYFKFIENYFFIFTKDSNYIISSISKEREGKTFSELLKEGSVDDSYIVSIMACESCGHYSIEIEQCDI